MVIFAILIMLCLFYPNTLVSLLFWIAFIGLVVWIKISFEEPVSFYLTVALFSGLILFCVYHMYTIWKIPRLNTSQKWALMNGKDFPIVQSKESSAYDEYRASFYDADKVLKRNQQWARSKVQSRSAEYELDKSGTKYIRIK